MSPTISYRRATTWADLLATARVIVLEYRRMGYIKCADDQVQNHVVRIAKALKKFEVFIACRGDEVVTTLSVIKGRKLPIDRMPMFGRRVHEFRKRGFKVGEIGKCAGRYQTSVALTLMAEAVRFQFQEGHDAIVVSCHPDYNPNFYINFGRFQRLTSEVYYNPEFDDAPAVGLIGFRDDILDSRFGRYMQNHPSVFGFETPTLTGPRYQQLSHREDSVPVQGLW